MLAFPCNQFGNQEPGSRQEIASFARGRYQASEGVWVGCGVWGGLRWGGDPPLLDKHASAVGVSVARELPDAAGALFPSINHPQPPPNNSSHTTIN